jgi:NADH:ubiquinone oxidoreductase subunit F (NADH-binding)
MQLAEALAAARTTGERPATPVAGPARLLAELRTRPGSSGPTEAVPLAEHRLRYRAPPGPRGSGDASRIDLIDLIGRSGLSGRGGAAFPTGRKLDAVANGRGRAVVVVNGAEGEPASGKDRLLLRRLPHLVIDGALIAAAAVGADRVVICIDRTSTAALASVQHAVAERAAERATERTTAIAIDVAATPPRYVAGESSALVQWLNDGPAKPTANPPAPRQRGVAGRPTLVQNVETLAHLAQIARFGAEWFRQVGTAAEPGTALLTVSGAVGRPAVIETAIGTPIEHILAGAGGLVGEPQALLIGGFFGTWVPTAAARHVPFSRAGLAPLGAQPGSGVVIALPEGACGLAETARILAWYAAESAGQCGPCLYGLADLAAGAASLAQPHTGGTAGTAGTAPAQVAQLRRWADQIEGRGACHHPDGAVNLLRSALWAFADDLARHEQGWPCLGASAPPALHVPAAHTTWR